MKRKLLVLVLLIALFQSVSAAVSLSANTPDPIYQGESTTVTVTATASGTSASNVTITIGLPSGLSTSSATQQMIASISAGQSQSVSWTITGDNASSTPYTITFNASGGATASTTTQLSVIAPPYIEVNSKVCPSSTANVGDDLTVSFTLRNSGGDVTNTQVDMSYSTSYLNLKSGSDPWSQDINAGGQVALSYDFNAINSGSATITALITSNQNNPEDVECTITISAVAGDGICSSGETDSGSNNGCATGYYCSNGSCVQEQQGGTVCGDGQCESGETCSSCPQDCGSCIGAKKAAAAKKEEVGVEERQTILEKTIEKKPTGEELRQILERAGASETAIEKAVAAIEKTTVKRSFKVEKITTTEGEVSYQTTITITVEDKAGKKIRNVKVIEIIPKNVFVSITEEDITTELDFEILQADPILQFIVPEIEEGGTASVEYAIAKDVNSEQADSWEKAVVAEFVEEEIDKCAGVKCYDLACRIGECNPETGECVYTNKEDGTSCGERMECKQGKCIEIVEELPPKETPTEKPAETPVEEIEKKPIDFTIPVIIIILVGCGVIAYFFYYKEKGKKSPLQIAAEKAFKGK